MEALDVEENSLTPPLSPVLVQDRIHQVLVSQDEVQSSRLFSCQGGTRHNLERLLCGQDPCPHKNLQPGAELFHSWWSTMQLTRNIENLFLAVRQQISRLEQGCFSSSNLQDTQDQYLQIRQRVLDFFDYLKLYVFREGNVLEENWRQHLLDHVHDLFLYLERLPDLPSLGFSNSRVALHGQAYQVFHLNLDIRWSLVELLVILEPGNPGLTRQLCTNTSKTQFVPRTMLDQMVLVLLWDLVILAMKKYQVDESSQDGPFLCNCVRHLWVLLLHLLDHRHRHLGTESLWTNMSSILLTIMSTSSGTGLSNTGEVDMPDCDVIQLPPEFDIQDSLGFSWWLLAALCPLSHCDAVGIHKTQIQVQGCRSILQMLLKRTFGREVHSEARLRKYLRWCQQTCQHLEPQADTVTHIWEYLCKKLNDSFELSGTGVWGFTFSRLSGADWLQSIKKKCGDQQSCLGYNSFEYFLYLLWMHLKPSPFDKHAQVWKSFKGRLYSKFHARRLQELTDLGLYNLTSIFLVLATLVDLQDVCGKLLELYTTVSQADLSAGRRQVIWQGVFAMALMYKDRDTDISTLANWLHQELGKVARDLQCTEERDSAGLWKLVNVYADGAQEIFETETQLHLSEYRLLGSSLRDILNTCTDQQRGSILGLVQTVLTKLRLMSSRTEMHQQKHHEQYQRLADCVWQNFYPAVRTLCGKHQVSPQVADLAAGFTLLAIDRPVGIQRSIGEDWLSCIKDFALNHQVNAGISCRYLCHILPNEAVMSKLSSCVAELDVSLIQAWVRCILQVSEDNAQLQELSRLVMKLPCVQTVLAAGSGTKPDPASYYQFIQALGDGYNKLQNFKEKLEYRSKVEKYLGDVPGHVSVVLKTRNSQEDINTVYKVTGHLVKHCAQLIYVKTKHECMLPVLLERLIFPRALMQPNKTVPAVILSAIRQHLHLFIQGLGSLNFMQDMYVQRKVKDAIHQFLPRFSMRSSGIGSLVHQMHPIVTAVCKSSGQPSAETTSLRQFILKTVCNDLLMMKGTVPPPTANLALSFLLEVCRETQNYGELCRDVPVLLGTILDYLLMCEVDSSKSKAAAVLQTLLQGCRRAASTALQEMAEPLQSFVERHLSLYQARAIQVVESVAALYPALVREAVPTLTRTIKANETKRGVGMDKDLRRAYSKVLSQVGYHPTVQPVPSTSHGAPEHQPMDITIDD